jgi:hypothetical protein
LIYDKGNAAKFASDAEELVPKADANWPKAVAELNQDPYH